MISEVHISCWWRHLFPTFPSAFKHVKSLLEESFMCFHCQRLSGSLCIFKQRWGVHFDMRGDVCPEGRLNHASAPTAEGEKFSCRPQCEEQTHQKRVHTSTLISFNCFILQHNTGLFTHSMGLKTPTGLCLLYIWKMGHLWWASCVRTYLQISAVTSLLSEILEIYTTAEKTRNLAV